MLSLPFSDSFEKGAECETDKNGNDRLQLMNSRQWLRTLYARLMGRPVFSYILMRFEELFRVDIGVDVMHQHCRTVDVHDHGHHEPADGGINKGMDVCLSLRMNPLAGPQPAKSALPAQLESLQFGRKPSLSRRIRNRMACRHLV